MADKKTPRSATVRIDEDLVLMLRTIKYASDIEGERFRVVEYLSGLIRADITARNERALTVIHNRKKKK